MSDVVAELDRWLAPDIGLSPYAAEAIQRARAEILALRETDLRREQKQQIMVRNATLEEAAQECEALGDLTSAAAIRALKEP